DDVAGGAEAVEAQPLSVAAEAQRPIADQTGAEERRSLEVLEAGRDGEAVALVRYRQLGVAAVELITREARPFAEVLPAGAAVGALTAGPAEPRDSHAVARPEAFRSLPGQGHLADDLVPRDE